MIGSKRFYLLLPVAVLISQSVSAHPFDHLTFSSSGNDDVFWFLFFLLVLSPFILSLILGVLTFVYKSIVLQIFAWIFTGIAFFESVILGRVEFGGLFTAVPAISAALVVSGLAGRTRGNSGVPYVIAGGLSCFAASKTLPFFLRLLPHGTWNVWVYCGLMLIIQTVVLAIVLRKVATVGNPVRGWQMPLLWSCAIGVGGYIIDQVSNMQFRYYFASMRPFQLQRLAVLALVWVAAGFIAAWFNNNSPVVRSTGSDSYPGRP